MTPPNQAPSSGDTLTGLVKPVAGFGLPSAGSRLGFFSRGFGAGAPGSVEHHHPQQRIRQQHPRLTDLLTQTLCMHVTDVCAYPKLHAGARYDVS